MPRFVSTNALVIHKNLCRSTIESTLCQCMTVRQLHSRKQERLDPRSKDSTEDCRVCDPRPGCCVCWPLTKQGHWHPQRHNPPRKLSVSPPVRERYATIKTQTDWGTAFSPELWPPTPHQAHNTHTHTHKHSWLWLLRLRHHCTLDVNYCTI